MCGRIYFCLFICLLWSLCWRPSCHPSHHCISPGPLSPSYWVQSGRAHRHSPFSSCGSCAGVEISDTEHCSVSFQHTQRVELNLRDFIVNNTNIGCIGYRIELGIKSNTHLSHISFGIKILTQILI